MSISILPKTKLGQWSLGLIIAAPILFSIGRSLTNTLYQSVTSGRTIIEDIAKRPLLAISMLLGMAAGITALITGLISLIENKERAVFVYLSTLFGALLTLFIIANLVFPE
jgi:hypothetical protein